MQQSLLYRYILNPVQTVRYFSKTKPVKEAFLCIAVVAFTLVSQGIVTTFGQIIGGFFFAFILTTLALAVQSITLDFFAQLFKLRAQSLRLFCWLALSLLPLALLAPLTLMGIAAPYAVKVVAGLLKSVALIMVVVFQVITIKRLYGTSFGISIFIFLAPFFIGFLIFSSLAIIGIVLMILSFTGLPL